METSDMNITFEQFEQLYRNGYTLDMVFLLQGLESGEIIPSMLVKDNKLDIIFQTMDRKGLCTKEGKITLSGKMVLNYITEETSIPKKNWKTEKKKVEEDVFDRWYKVFPSTDTFSYKGKTFNGTRSLKAKKEDCKNKLKAILNEGEYTIDEMIKALELEIHQKKENSIKTGTNKLSFMQNSFTYLNQRSYESFIELIKEGVEIKETNLVSSGGTDI